MQSLSRNWRTIDCTRAGLNVHKIKSIYTRVHIIYDKTAAPSPSSSFALVSRDPLIVAKGLGHARLVSYYVLLSEQYGLEENF